VSTVLSDVTSSVGCHVNVVEDVSAIIDWKSCVTVYGVESPSTVACSVQYTFVSGTYNT
jgi:hypothetical protein